MAKDESGEAPRSRAYRARLIRPEGRIETTIDIMAESEVEAADRALSLAHSYAVELWQGDRLVMRVPLQR